MRARGVLVGLALGALALPGTAWAAVDFRSVEYVSVGASAVAAISIADVTGDGRADVVATTDAPGVAVLAQQADGTLATPRSYALPASTAIRGLAVADIDSDGKVDVAVATLLGVQLLYQQQDGSLAAAQTVAGTNRAFELAIADMNGDAKPDLVVASDYGLKEVLNTGAGFAPSVIADGTYRSLSAADVTGDGRPDVVGICVLICNGSEVLTQQTDGSFTRKSYILLGWAEPLVGNLIGDATAEVVATTGFNSPNSWLAIHPGSANGLGMADIYGTYEVPGVLAAADLDGDGRQDIVVAHHGWSTVGVLLQTADGSFARELLFDAGCCVQPLNVMAVGDLNGDGKPDIVFNEGDLAILYSGGTGASAAHGPQTTITSGPRGVVPASATSARFSFTSTGTNPWFQCSLDYATATACASPVTFTNLAPGAHRFKVRTSSSDGGPEPFFAARAWSVGEPNLAQTVPPLSATPPDTTITSAPPSSTSSNSASFSYTSDVAGAQFQCDLDGDPAANSSWGLCVPPIVYRQLSSGQHTFSVRAVDSTEHRDPSPASYIWTVTLPPPGPPPNDDFAAAQALPADTASAGFGLARATKEPGEPNHAGNPGGHSVWFAWTPAASETVTFDTDQSFDTLLAVYTGTTVDGLTLVAANDDVDATVRTSRVSFEAVAGQAYRIAIDGKDGATGIGALNISAIPSPPPDTTPPDTNITGGPSGTVTATTASFTFTSTDPPSSFWCRLDGQAWVACTSPQDYTGPFGGSHTFDVRAADAAGNVDATPATQTWTVQAPAPTSNDYFASATPLTGASGSTTGTTTGMSRENGEPPHGGNAGGHSIWFTWTAQAAGTVAVTTAGSNFDTLLAVYTGSDLSLLSRLAWNDDVSPGDLTSSVTFTAVAGTTYRIAVDGYGVSTGSVTLNWAQGARPWGPANDDFASAAVLSSSATGTTVGATKEAGEPSHAGNRGGKSIWWTWKAPTAGATTITLAGSSFDTLLAVYTGSSVTALIAVASNDDANGTLQSQVSFTAAAGTTYRVAVDGYDGVTGSVSIRVKRP